MVLDEKDRAMDIQPDGSVVVGIDLSGSRHAVDEGIRQARLLHCPLHLVHATGVGLVSSAEEYLARTEEELRRHARQIAELAPDVKVTHEVRVADPAATLVAAAGTARLVVMGSAGLPRAADAIRDATARKGRDALGLPRHDRPARRGLGQRRTGRRRGRRE
jgi:hypothetical protein